MDGKQIQAETGQPIKQRRMVTHLTGRRKALDGRVQGQYFIKPETVETQVVDAYGRSQQRYQGGSKKEPVRGNEARPGRIDRPSHLPSVQEYLANTIPVPYPEAGGNSLIEVCWHWRLIESYDGRCRLWVRTYPCKKCPRRNGRKSMRALTVVGKATDEGTIIFGWAMVEYGLGNQCFGRA